MRHYLQHSVSGVISKRSGCPLLLQSPAAHFTTIWSTSSFHRYKILNTIVRNSITTPLQQNPLPIPHTPSPHPSKPVDLGIRPPHSHCDTTPYLFIWHTNHSMPTQKAPTSNNHIHHPRKNAPAPAFSSLQPPCLYSPHRASIYRARVYREHLTRSP